MTKPFVSIIIATKNEEKNIGLCLESIKRQTYAMIEIIVVDNNSSDKTKEIARKYTEQVFTKGPERSPQRNFGAKNAQGEYLLFLDADMRLSQYVVRDCVLKMQSKENVAVTIPEKSIGQGFWAACKALEKSYYIGVDWIEAPRFFRKSVFLQVNGYDKTLISGEDWDLSQRVQEKGQISHINTFILHDEGNLTLFKTLYHKWYYGKFIAAYFIGVKNKTAANKQKGVISRYILYFSQPKKLFAHPLIGLGMLFMKSCEYVAGGIGYVMGMRASKP